jgi:hypothetical protein
MFTNNTALACAEPRAGLCYLKPITMDLTAFAPKDRALIKNNPDKTPYELLALGLSQKAYERLTVDGSTGNDNAGNDAPPPGNDSDQGTGAVAPASPAAPGPVVERVKINAAPIQPTTRPYNGNTGGVFTQRTVVGPNGIPQKLSAKQAERLVASSPKYKFVD